MLAARSDVDGTMVVVVIDLRHGDHQGTHSTVFRALLSLWSSCLPFQWNIPAVAVAIVVSVIAVDVAAGLEVVSSPPWCMCRGGRTTEMRVVRNVCLMQPF